MCAKETNRYFLLCNDGIRYRECKFGALRRLKNVIPAKYCNLTFNDYTITEDNKRAVGLSKKFCHEQKGGLYLYGALQHRQNVPREFDCESARAGLAARIRIAKERAQTEDEQ